MKGGYIHEYVILNTLEGVFKETSTDVSRQVLVRMGAKTGFVDLAARLGSARLAIEAEMAPSRVAGDIEKAAALDAWLWIVTPNSRVADSVRAELGRLRLREHPPCLCVLTLGQAVQRLRIFLPILSSGKELKTVTGQLRVVPSGPGPAKASTQTHED